MARGSFLLLAAAVAAQDFHGVPHPRAPRQAPAVNLRGDRYGGRYHGLDEAQYIRRRQEGEAQVAHARETGELSAALEAELVEGKDCWWEGARAASLDRAVLFSLSTLRRAGDEWKDVVLCCGCEGKCDSRASGAAKRHSGTTQGETSLRP